MKYRFEDKRQDLYKRGSERYKVAKTSTSNSTT
jgi:hypothetical protein